MNKRTDNVADMLRGNINRMCVTDSKEELLQMYAYANIRLNEIFVENRERIKAQKYVELLGKTKGYELEKM